MITTLLILFVQSDSLTTTPMDTWSYWRHIETVEECEKGQEYLLSNYKTLDMVLKFSDGRPSRFTPLSTVMMAWDYENRMHLLESLLENGANINWIPPCDGCIDPTGNGCGQSAFVSKLVFLSVDDTKRIISKWNPNLSYEYEHIEYSEARRKKMFSGKYGDIFKKDFFERGDDKRMLSISALHKLLHHTSAKEELINILVANGISPNLADESGNTPLHILANRATGDYMIGGDPSVSVIGKSKLLLDLGADINLRNNNGTSILGRALSFTTPEVVRFLIDQGASLSARDANGSSLLEVSAHQGRGNKELEAYGIASRHLKIKSEVISVLLSKREWSKADIVGALIQSASYADLQLIDMLLSKLQDNLSIRQESELWRDLSFNSNAASIADHLLSNCGFNIDNQLIENKVRDDGSRYTLKGDTPLINAVQCGNVELVKKLLSLGADTSTGGRMGEDVVFAAIYGAFSSGEASDVIEILSLLDKSGVSIKTWRGLGGANALHEAIRYCKHPSVIMKILDYKIPILEKHDGETVLDMAKENTYFYRTKEYWTFSDRYYSAQQ
jgi:ankyrin repeat protein